MFRDQANIFRYSHQNVLGEGITGLSPTALISKDGGSFSASTNSVTEVDSTIAPGLYQLQLTQAECTCDLLSIQISLPNGEWPAQAFLIDMEVKSNLTASDVWQYTTRTLTAGSLTAQQIWEYSTRTLTASALTAQQVWEYTARTLTASPTDISSLATSTDVSNAQTAIINAMSVPPSASTIATEVLNASVADRNTGSLGSTVLAISGYTDDVESKIDAVSTKLTDLPIIRALLDRWVVDGTTLTCYDSEGNTLESCTLTKDDRGNIVAVTPNA